MTIQTLIKAGLISLIATACATKHAEQTAFLDLEIEETEEVKEEATIAEIQNTQSQLRKPKEQKVADSKDYQVDQPMPSIISGENANALQQVEMFEGGVTSDFEMDVGGMESKAMLKKKERRGQRNSLNQNSRVIGDISLTKAPVMESKKSIGNTIGTAINLRDALTPPQDSATSGEEYVDYGINAFVDTAEDALSTFSIDVDTASYTIARRKLNEGKMPAFEGIRVEEFINYFDYHYDSSDAKPFVVDMEAMVHPFKADRHILRVGLQGQELAADTRPALHLTFLVDVSGSMSSADKLPLAKEAMHMLVDTLRDDDTVAMATYAGNISKILDPTHGDSKKKIHAAIDRLTSGGSTAMSSGLDLAYEMAWNSFEAGAENRVIVLSDGDANVGRTSWSNMLKQIKSYADRGVTMSTMGFGMGNYKDTAMEQLANKGDGNNFYIDSRAQAHRVFVEDFNSSMINIARDVKIQMDFNPEVVESYRLIGYENRDIADKDFRNDRVDAGEIGSGHNVTALYELVLAESYGDEKIATARLRYEKPGADSVATERSWNVDTSDISSKREASDSLKIAFTAGTFAEILRKSPHVSGISLTDLIQYGEGAKRRGEKDDIELIHLIEKARELSENKSLVLGSVDN